MQEKQKVTLYLPPELHRQLKIKAAVEDEPMSAIAERALSFYLAHSEVVDSLEASYGQTHQVYHCPDCSSPVVLLDGDLVSLKTQPGVLSVPDSTPATVAIDRDDLNLGEEMLVPC